MSVNKLVYRGVEYDAEIIAGVGGLEMSHAMVGETLSVDVLTIGIMTQDLPVRLICDDQDDNSFLLTEDNYIICVPGGAPVPEFKENEPCDYYFNGDLVGRYYLQEIKQTGPYEYNMRAYSAMWLLEQSRHFGGMYAEDTPAGEVIANIIGNVVPYSIDADVAAVPISNYLPIGSRRSNLQKVLNAIGASVRNAADGSLHITSLSDVPTGTFDKSRVFYGGSVVSKTPVTAVEATEHTYIESDEMVTFDDESHTSTKTIEFPEPLHDIQATNATIIDSNCNYCTYTGSGSGAIAITGKKYTHITRTVVYGTPPIGIGSDNVRQVEENTLLGPTNALQVAERVYNLLSVKDAIRQEVVVGTERAGDVVSVVHPYTGEIVSATMQKASLQFGVTELRAICEYLVNYVPPSIISGFTHYTILTGSGTFTPEEGVVVFRAILVGAGNGGSGGRGGQAGNTANSNGGDGGTKGLKGLGGRVFATTLAAGTYSYNCGSGGTGGAGGAGATISGQRGEFGEDGGAGGETTFGDYSSAFGNRYPEGYYEKVSGLTVAADGIDGADGGFGLGFPIFHSPTPVSTSITWQGNTWYSGTFYGATTDSPAPGGPAVGSNGGDDVTGTPPSGPDDGYRAGNGAHALIDGATVTQYGGGGNGGHGGGGGGGRWLATYGYGGDGSDGSDGGEGCIIILW